jgi:hypothetical protein
MNDQINRNALFSNFESHMKKDGKKAVLIWEKVCLGRFGRSIFPSYRKALLTRFIARFILLLRVFHFFYERIPPAAKLAERHPFSANILKAH